MKTEPNELISNGFKKNPVYDGLNSNTIVGYETNHNNGLTKREYFAAMAMQGILSNSQISDDMSRRELPDSEVVMIVKRALVTANTLIAELNKET